MYARTHGAKMPPAPMLPHLPPPRPHCALPSACFSHATASTRWNRPPLTASVATLAVEHPTLPAVCTRSMGLPCGAERVGEEQLGLHDAFEDVGRLAHHQRVDVTPVEAGVVERAARRLAHEAGDGDVGARLRVLGLADADDAGRLCAVCSPRSLQDADEVLLERLTGGGVGEDAARGPAHGSAGPLR